jgi:hypothetical protein
MGVESEPLLTGPDILWAYSSASGIEGGGDTSGDHAI